MQANNMIGVIGGEGADGALDVLSALAQPCGLMVRRAHASEIRALAGFIVLGTPGEQAAAAPVPDRPSMRVFFSESAPADASVRFSAAPYAPWPFSGRTLRTGSAVPGAPPVSSATVIAAADGQPVWTTTSEGGMRHDTCWVSRPWIGKGECVFTHLHATRFMNLLPLLEWFRQVPGGRAWERPPLRACFMFDDPNLHAVRYGFARFDQLAEEAKRDHYHVAFATVPLDGYYVNRAAARIIRDNPEGLSLLVHGNNHTYRELAGRQEAREQVAQMRQAIQRTSALEQKAGVVVSRVMAPPHGVCSAEMMGAMSRAGFEAACISHGSVQTGNPGAEWTVAMGAYPATVIDGLPVIPRFGLDRHVENGALLAAYLRQPIIPMAHHWDLADGTKILSAAAHFINSLGRVEWSNMTAIARGNYLCAVDGHVMRIRTFSRWAAIDVPAGVTELEVEAAWLDPLRETVACRRSDGSALPVTRGSMRFDVTPGSRVDWTVSRTSDEGEQPRALPRTPLGVIARKVLVELRDRAMPHLPRKWVRT